MDVTPRLAALALALGLVASGPLSATDQTCRRSVFSLEPTWVGSGFWNGPNLVLLDSGERGLRPYASDGWARQGISLTVTKKEYAPYPLGVARRSDGKTGDGKVIVYEEFNRFLILGPSLGFEKSFDASLPTDKGNHISKIYNWAPTWSPRSKNIVALADLRKPGVTADQWSTGVVRFSLDEGKKSPAIELGENLSLRAATRQYHRLGYPYVAALQENAYILTMEKGFQLWVSDRNGGFRQLEKFSESFPVKEVPKLPSFLRPEDYPLLMAEVETSAMPTGLYSWEENLYLLWRRPDLNSETKWLLSRIDPKDGNLVATAGIPSGANHLLAVPGREWAFIEKGPALGLQEQEVRRFMIVPGSRVKQTLSAAKSSPVSLCP